jgi:hypothetical protein
MKVANAQAEPCRRLESAAWGVHSNGRRRKGILGREHEGAPVLTILIWGARGSGQDIVPSRQTSTSRNLG